MKFLPPRNKSPLNYSMRRKYTNMTQLLFSPWGNAREELAGAKEFLDEAMREWTKDFHEIDFHREIPCGIQTYFCISLWSKNLFIFGFPPCTSMWHPKSTLILPSQLKYLPLLGHLPLRHISNLSLYSFCQSPNKIFLKMYSQPNMVEACMSPSGQLLNAVWSHCLSCLNEIRGFSRQASPW